MQWAYLAMEPCSINDLTITLWRQGGGGLFLGNFHQHNRRRWLVAMWCVSRSKITTRWKDKEFLPTKASKELTHSHLFFRWCSRRILVVIMVTLAVMVATIPHSLFFSRFTQHTPHLESIYKAKEWLRFGYKKDPMQKTRKNGRWNTPSWTLILIREQRDRFSKKTERVAKFWL